MATLNQITSRLLKSRNNNGKELLKHMVAMTEHMLKEHDWDAAARFIRATDGNNASDSNLNRTFRTVVRLAFGPRISLKRDAKHDTGYRFIFGNDGKWPEGEIIPSNTFAIVLDAVAAGTDVNNAGFQKTLRETLRGDKVDPTYEKIKEGYEKKAANAAKALMKDGVDPAVFANAFANAVALLKAENAKYAEMVVKPGEKSDETTIIPEVNVPDEEDEGVLEENAA